MVGWVSFLGISDCSCNFLFFLRSNQGSFSVWKVVAPVRLFIILLGGLFIRILHKTTKIFYLLLCFSIK
jgi:hypothetical protein